MDIEIINNQMDSGDIRVEGIEHLFHKVRPIDLGAVLAHLNKAPTA